MKRALFALLTVAIGALLVVGTVVFMGRWQPEPAVIVATVDGTMQTPQGELPHATLDLSVYPNSTPDVPGPTGGANIAIENDGWPFWWPSTTLQLPAHSVITMRVHQYDGSTTVWNPYFAKVHGTLDGTATFNGTKRTEIEPQNVAHTFTIHQYPESDQPYWFVSVPMLAAPNNAKPEANGYPKPQIIEFTFITGEPGEYVWNCEDPCGSGYMDFGGVMSERGWMSGTVTVV